MLVRLNEFHQLHHAHLGPGVRPGGRGDSRLGVDLHPYLADYGSEGRLFGCDRAKLVDESAGFGNELDGM